MFVYESITFIYYSSEDKGCNNSWYSINASFTALLICGEVVSVNWTKYGYSPIIWFHVFLLTVLFPAFFIEAITVAMALRTNEISATFCLCKGMFLFSFSLSIASCKTSLNLWSKDVIARMKDYNLKFFNIDSL